MTRLKTITMICAGLLLLAAPAFAQGDLSDEELALLERIAEATDAVEDATSYVSTLENVALQQFDITLSGNTQAIFEQVAVSAERVVTLGDDPYGTAFYTVELEQNDGLNPPVSYVLEIEFRYVDGTLYAQGAYVESEGEVPPVEEGWVIVEDPFAFPFLIAADVGELFELFNPVDEDEAGEEQTLLEVITLIRDQATSVTLEETQLDDETYDVITIAFGWDGLLAILEAENQAPPEGDPIFEAFATSLAGVADVVQVSFLLDADDTMIGLAYETDIEINDIDMGELDPSTAGVTLDTLVLNLVESETRTDLNAAFDVPEVPEVTTAG